MLQKLKKLSIPRSPTKLLKHQRVTPAHDPELFVDLYRYCRQDVRTEKAVGAAVPALSEFELKVWMLDQEINECGVQVDLEGIENCIRVVEATVAKYARLCEILDDPTVTIDQVEKLRTWVNSHGIHKMFSFDKAAVTDALRSLESYVGTKRIRDIREVLEIRQALGAKSIQKLYTMQRTTCRDGRIRGLFEYCGARQTGRFSARFAQPHNLLNHGPAINRVDEALFDFSLLGNSHLQNMLEAIESKYGNILETVGSVLRGLFIAAPGKDLICSDYSAIEAVIVAEIAEESWMQEVFRTHGKLYETTAAMVTGTPVDAEGNHPNRKLGKVASLASAYQGALGAWIKFGADEFMTEEEILAAVKTWRSRCPNIVNLWYGLEKAAKAAIMTKGAVYTYKFIKYQVREGNLFCKLPSNRELIYHNAALEAGKFGLQIAYDGWNSDSTKGPVGWMRRYTYGGSLTENCCQAIARDILAHAMLNLDKCEYPIVLHVHDEIVAEIDKGFGSVGEFEFIMNIMPPWASGWPIKAKGGWRGRRYRKG